MSNAISSRDSIASRSKRLTSLSLNGRACSGMGGDSFKCNAGTLFDTFTLSVVPGLLVSGTHPEDLRLSGSTTPVPEPSTWAMMLAGFTGLGFVACRSSRKTQAAA